jgi:hypothetical protein
MAYEDKPWLLFPASDPMASPGAWGFNYDSGEWYPVNSGADPSVQKPNLSAPPPAPVSGAPPIIGGVAPGYFDAPAPLPPAPSGVREAPSSAPYAMSPVAVGGYVTPTTSGYGSDTGYGDVTLSGGGAPAAPPGTVPGYALSPVGMSEGGIYLSGPPPVPTTPAPVLTGSDPLINNPAREFYVPPPTAGAPAGAPYVPPAGGAVMPGGGGGSYGGGAIDPYTGAPSSPFAAPMQPMAGGGGGYGAPPPGPFPFGHAGVANPMPPASPMRNHVLGALGLPGPAWAPATQMPPQQQPLDPTRQAIIDGLTQVPAPPPPPMSPMRYVEAKLGLEPESIVPPPPYAGGPKAFMPPVPTQDQQKAMFPNSRRAMPPMGGMRY